MIMDEERYEGSLRIKMRFRRSWMVIFILLNGLRSVPLLAQNTVTGGRGDQYPYGGKRFTAFVEESYHRTGTPGLPGFYAWMDSMAASHVVRLSSHRPERWVDIDDREARHLKQIRDPRERAGEEIRLAAWLHRSVKSILPRFSLERGFEFSNAVRYQERQCFLQSVLIAGLLQAMGVDAGVVMVSRNLAGQPINNAHAVAIVKLADGREVEVDASERMPFARMPGLFAALTNGRYVFVEPVFAGTSSYIIGYRPVSGGTSLKPRMLRGLDFGFVRSQFEYYRGERSPGGLLAKRPTSEGLSVSARCLRESLRECPRNPLPAYMLGRVFQKADRPAEARQQFQRAMKLYTLSGWVPQSVRQALATTYATRPR